MQLIYRQIQINEYLEMTNMIKQVSDESNFYPFTSEDYNVCQIEQEAFIKRLNESNNCFLLGAFCNDRLVGIIYLYGGNRQRTYHNCTLGIGILEEYANKGIGSKLLEYAIKYSYDSDVIGKINIQVVKENKKAIKFYKKYNFQIEGIEKRALFIDNEFYDCVNLGLIIK